MEAIQRHYTQTLPARIHHVRALWSALGDSADRENDLAEMHRAVHTLSGSGATFGYAGVSEAAREIERLLRPSDDPISYPATAEIVIIESLLDQLELETTSETAAASKPIQPEVSKDSPAMEIFLADRDADVARNLAGEIAHAGYAVTIFSTLDALEERLCKFCPAAIVMDMELFGENSLAARVTERISRLQDPPPPVLFLSRENSFESRLVAVRAGAAAYFPRPVDGVEFVEKLDRLTGQTPPNPYRILIVDDDPVMAEYYASVLEAAGMITSTLCDPMEAMGRIIDFSPDLMLIDLYMPGCSGIELAQVIRQQAAYAAIPLVFLSSENSQDKQLSAIKLGGDAFLTKPVNDVQLIASITNRAERSRMVRSLMMRDGLTGLLDHSNIKEQLGLEVNRAARTSAIFSFAMLDIDHFKRVNDTYGHPTGDRVIKSLSQMLTRRLRKSDIIGRYGGEEFAVILVNTDKQVAQKIIDQIRADFAAVTHQSGGRTFSVTFSCGIAEYPDFTNQEQINRAADDALYEAKHQGRNRISLALKGLYTNLR